MEHALGTVVNEEITDDAVVEINVVIDVIVVVDLDVTVDVADTEPRLPVVVGVGLVIDVEPGFAQ